MLPLKLKINGLYSYQEPCEIDFTKLTDAYLFGIFGSVGSGKSTILEAISFALYGETERLNRKDNRGYNMMNLKSSKLEIDFQFQAPNHQDNTQTAIYRFTVTGKRNSKNFQKINTFERKAYIQNLSPENPPTNPPENLKWLPLETSSAAEIIGLSYENFRRTIIIPQGKFQEFLHMSDTDRTKMMKSIFSLEKYDLYDKITTLEKTVIAKLENLAGQMTQLQEINPEQLKILETTQKDLNQTIIKHNLQLEQNQQTLNKFDQFISDQTKIQNLITELQKSQQTLTIHQKELTTQLKTATTENQKIKGKHQNRHLIKEEINDLQNIIEISTLTHQSTTTTKRIKDGEKILRELKGTITKLQTEITNSQNNLKKDKAKQFSPTQTANIASWLEKTQHFQNQSTQLNQKIQALATTIKSTKIETPNFPQVKELPPEFHQLWQTEITKLQNSPSNKNYQSLINTITPQLPQNLESLTNNLTELNVQSKLSEFAKDLKEGSACHLCGSISHPKPLKSESIDQQLESTNQQISNLKLIQQFCQALQIQLEKHQLQLTTKENELQETQKIFNELQSQINNHLHQITNLNFKNLSLESRPPAHITETKPIIQELQNLLANAAEQAEQIKTQENKIEKLQTTLDTHQKNKDRYQAVIDQLNQEQTANHSKIETLTKQLKQIKLPNFDLHSSETPTKLNQTLTAKNQEYQQIETAFTNSEVHLQKITQATQTNTTKLETTSQELQKNQKNLTHIQEQLKALSFSPENHQQLINTTNQLKNTLTKANQELGEMKQKITTLQKQIALAKELGQQKINLTKRQDNITTIKALFKAQGFVNFISSHYLHNLCESANQRFFKLTNQSLRLELKDDNTFQVRDFLNNGQLRSIKTLSGGQTFQASLSLALALADNVQKLHHNKQNFFFLDEGFGTLDPESLETVLQTLKSLRLEHKVVGVISHVENLKQEISVYLNIKKDSQKGSQIRYSWT